MDSRLIPNVSVDCVVFGFDLNTLNVLLVERVMEYEAVTYTDLKLPGDLVRWDEDIDKAAVRILFDLSGLSNIYLKQFHSFGDVNRLKGEARDLVWLKAIDHPEERVITMAYFSLLDLSDNANNQYILQSNARWVPVYQLPHLAFDHGEIVMKALENLRIEIKQKPLAFELLPLKFTLTQLQKLYEVVLGTTYDKRNFRKKIGQISYVVPINEKQTNVAHKPARLYMFSRDIYEKTHKDSFDFTV